MEKVLIVDDNPLNIKVLGELLKETYKLYIANNGEKAISIAKDSKPDIVLLDVMMPDMDGYSVCLKLKENSETEDIPVIFITAKNSTDDVVRGFEVGGRDYLQKPFRPEELLARLRTHIELKKSREKIKEDAENIANKNIELEKYISELNRTKEKLMFLEKMATIGRFAGGIAHEINSPLVGIMTCVELMKQDVADLTPESIEEKKQEFFDEIDMIKASSEKIRQIILGISNYSDKYDKSINRNRIIELFEVAIENERNKINGSEISINMQINDGVEFEGNAKELINLFSAIIDNSIDAIILKKSGSIGKIDILVEEKLEEIVIRIEDNGVGIEEAIKGKIFDPFFTTKTIGENAGLGLNVAYGIVSKYNGEIICESEKNVFTRIVIKLPTKAN